MTVYSNTQKENMNSNKQQTMSNNKQTMKLYTEADLKKVISIYSEEYKTSTDEILKELNLTPIELPSDEEIEEKLNVAYGNGYEQGEMDFYKKMQENGLKYNLWVNQQVQKNLVEFMVLFGCVIKYKEVINEQQ